MDHQRNEQGERADEVKARIFVEKYLGVNLKYVDLNGQVDYKFDRDGQDCALEVSRFTEELQKERWAGFRDGDELFNFYPLRRQWYLSAHGMPKIKDVKALILPALHILERYHLDSYWPSMQSWWFEHERELKQVAFAFRSVGVESAQSAIGMFEIDDAHPFNVGISFGMNWSYGNPDSALEIVENYIAGTGDNLKKLRESGAKERHLWLWLDRHTLRGVLEAFNGMNTLFPTRNPVLPEEVTHLWLVNEENEYGWFHGPAERWSRLSN